MSRPRSTRFEFLVYVVSGMLDIKMLDDHAGEIIDIITVRPRFDDHDMQLFDNYILRISRKLDERFDFGSCIVVSFLKVGMTEAIIETRFPVGKFSGVLCSTMAFHMNHTDQIE